ncbi:PREDICTED: aspartyl protease family protein 2-like [Nelumbo nucifera]|uniref:Aspartyl protease family protein 2-like n=1 Tax=Nelumbo nucifera TaxID=4432 RepID=A0A1U8Q6P2_NELNU|nr:PREDICTED: aspartyl protease family protein 2-like [Nelumbo nucifera]
MAEGFFANETVTVYLSTGKKIRLSEFLVGCTLATPGRNFTDGIHGMLALGASPYSFAGQAVEIFGGKFSYCLVDILSPKNVSNYIVFGHNVHPPNMQFTSLIVNKIAPFYAVRVIGISVGGELLGIPLSVWNEDREGGTIIDSGTSLMQLAEPAYRPIMDAFISSPGLKDYTRVDDEDFEFCISVKPGELDEERVPKLVIYFADGARLVPPVRNYLHEAAPELMCLAFQPVPFPGVSVIGNLIQQHYFWEFDFMKRRLGFAPSSCTQHGH